MAFCRDTRHLTPLHKAIILGQMEIAKFLIKNYPQTTNAMDEVSFDVQLYKIISMILVK